MTCLFCVSPSLIHAYQYVHSKLYTGMTRLHCMDRNRWIYRRCIQELAAFVKSDCVTIIIRWWLLLVRYADGWSSVLLTATWAVWALQQYHPKGNRQQNNVCYPNMVPLLTEENLRFTLRPTSDNICSYRKRRQTAFTTTIRCKMMINPLDELHGLCPTGVRLFHTGPLLTEYLVI